MIADIFDVSLDYMLGRTDEPRGKLYSYEPAVLRERFEDEAKMKAFVEFCFEPGTAGNEKLKAVLVEMLGGADCERAEHVSATKSDMKQSRGNQLKKEK
jgi:hypothetical protein